MHCSYCWAILSADVVNRDGSGFCSEYCLYKFNLLGCPDPHSTEEF